MLQVRFIASVAERDIDLLVMEELSVSDQFRDWFATRAYGIPVYGATIGAWHSVVDGGHGESDIVFAFTAQSGQRLALLIENKIDAPPQPEQGERYRVRGRNGVKSGYWDDFKTCVIAPDRYLNSAKHSQDYDAEVSYEELVAFFSSQRFRDPRFLYKARVVQEAVEQNRRGYQPEYNEAMTRFVQKYREKAAREHPTLGVQDAKPRPSGSTWIMFNPFGIPRNIALCHQMTSGAVKVFFYGAANELESIQARYAEAAPPESNLEFGQSVKAAYISAQVPRIDPLGSSFDREESNVTLALQKLSLLETLVRRVSGI